MTWRIDGPTGAESAKIRWELVPYTQGRGLDLGCGAWKAFRHFIGLDSNVDEKLFGMRATAADMIVPTCERLDLFADAAMDFVFSSHLLEHIEDHRAALAEWWRVVKVGGHLVLYLPHRDHYPNVGTYGANPDHKHDFVNDDILDAMRGVGGWDLLRNEERSGGDEYSFFQVFRKRDDVKQVYSLPVRPKKSAAVVRYGGIGDMLQAASVLPGLKAQGHHVTVYTTELGREILKHDPHIDAFYIQGTDQVPNEELGSFFDHEAAKYDRWVNLCESVEGSLLALPGRAMYSWPHEARHKLLNANYAAVTHDLAQVPHKFAARFYASPGERAWAQAERAKIKGRVICWSLSGSSVHKAWPWTDTIIARLMVKQPDTHVVLMGDALCQMLEEGWTNEPRVHCRSGMWTVRQSLAFVEQADMVIGPETGLLNAVGMLPMPKIVMLSHSSRENLTKHWNNTVALEPQGVSCFPCHKMHYGWAGCQKNEESSAAQCQHNISADQVWQILERKLKVAA